MFGDFDEPPKADAVTQTAAEIIDQAPLPDEAKTVLKTTLGLEGSAQLKVSKKGIPNDEEFFNQSLESNFESDPNAFITDDAGNEHRTTRPKT